MSSEAMYNGWESSDLDGYDANAPGSARMLALAFLLAGGMVLASVLFCAGVFLQAFHVIP